jgi:uncharacterized SAM-binding protein YcdF (DUF218 family)
MYIYLYGGQVEWFPGHFHLTFADFLLYAFPLAVAGDRYLLDSFEGTEMIMIVHRLPHL